MAGVSPSYGQTAGNLIASQSGGLNPTALAEKVGVNALNAIPVVGPALSAIAGPIIGLINAHHAKAVGTETKIIADAVPAFMDTLKLILQAYNAGQVTAAGANTYIDQAVEDYHSNVSGSGSGYIEGWWPYTGPQQSGVAPSHCNGPCYVGHWVIGTSAYEAKATIAQAESEGSAVGMFGPFVQDTQKDQTFRGYPTWSIALTKPSIVSSLIPASITSLLPASLQGNVGLAAGIIVGFFALIFLTARAGSR